jgi:type II secretory pathway component PulF
MQKHRPSKAKKYHLPAKEREYITTNLAQLLKAAVPIDEAVLSLAETSKSAAFKKAMAQIADEVHDGVSLWKALDHSGVAGSETLALIRLGEQSGRMSENMAVAAAQEQKQRMFRAKVRSAMLYPSFVLSLTAVVGLAVAWFLLPKLSVTFSQLNVQLPLISKIFIDAGLFLRSNGIWAVPAILFGGALLVYVVFFMKPTKRLGEWLLFHTPGISRLLFEVELARFGYLLGTLLQAGLNVRQALELMEESTPNHQYKAFYRYLRSAFDEGYNFTASLKKYRHVGRLLPPSAQQILIAGERSGSLAEALLMIGSDYEAKADITTQNLEVVLEPILLVAVSIGVLGVAIAVILPVYKLVGGLQT